MKENKGCPDEKTDEELVVLALKEPDFYLCLMQRYECKLLRYIKRLTSVSSDDAQDILQDVFIKTYQNLNDFDQSLKFSSWIYRITYNQVISNYRRNKARPQSQDLADNQEILEKMAADFDIKKEVFLKEQAGEVDKILNNLEAKYRDVLILRFFEDKDYREMSDILKKPPGTVASLISRAKEEFRKEVGKHGFSTMTEL